jgi:hypothetical protein
VRGGFPVVDTVPPANTCVSLVRVNAGKPGKPAPTLRDDGRWLPARTGVTANGGLTHGKPAPRRSGAGVGERRESERSTAAVVQKLSQVAHRRLDRLIESGKHLASASLTCTAPLAFAPRFARAKFAKLCYTIIHIEGLVRSAIPLSPILPTGRRSPCANIVPFKSSAS